LSLTAFCDDANISLIKWQAPLSLFISQLESLTDNSIFYTLNFTQMTTKYPDNHTSHFIFHLKFLTDSFLLGKSTAIFDEKFLVFIN